MDEQVRQTTELIVDTRGAKQGYAELTDAANRAAGAVDRTATSLDGAGTVTETTGRRVGLTARQIAALERAFDPAGAAARRLAEQQELVNRAAAAGQIQGEALQRVMAGMAQQQHLLAVAGGRTVTVNTSAGASFKGMGSLIGQAGYQVQDFLVQVASGQNVVTALTQQGSQLLGVLGPAGAIAGAVLAVGGLAANMLLMGDETDDAAKAADRFKSAMSGVDDILDDQKTSVADLTKAYAAMRGEMQTVTRLRLEETLAAATADLKRQAGEVRSLLEINGFDREGLFTTAQLRGGGSQGRPLPSTPELDAFRAYQKDNDLPRLIASLAAGGAEAQSMARKMAALGAENEETRQTIERLTAQLALYAGTATSTQIALLDQKDDTERAAKASERFSGMLTRLTGDAAVASNSIGDYDDALKLVRGTLAETETAQEKYARQADALESAIRIITERAAAAGAPIEKFAVTLGLPLDWIVRLKTKLDELNPSIAETERRMRGAHDEYSRLAAQDAADDARQVGVNFFSLFPPAVTDAMKKANDELDRSADRFGDTLANALIDGSFDGADIWKSAAATALSDGAEIAYTKITAAFDKAIPGLTGAIGAGLAGFGIGQSVGNMVGFSEAKSRNAGIGAGLGAGGAYLAGLGPWGIAAAGALGFFGGSGAGPAPSLGPVCNMEIVP
ncbi:hypothetical protein [Rhodocista pekingensis]|uniref:Bacteriophage tail tape measure N-terminal domain-containing protein n=1 Tax=Rhodocista pekingensis TaxID=201185 RepID=A0ABW2KUC0_9PROT